MSSHPENNIFWVTLPNCPMQYQAELLETRPHGYFVRWLIRKSTEVISLDSQLTKELPHRQRKPSPIKLMSLEHKQKKQKTDGSNPEEKEKTPRRKNSKRTGVKMTSNKSSNDKENNESLQSPPQHDMFEWVDKTTGIARPNLKYGTGEDTEAGEDDDDKQDTVLSKRKDAITGISLWKVHDISRSTAEARISQILQPYNLSHAARLVANLFIFAYERQCCWQRRNNEAKMTWSSSAIFQNYAFANVYRELDRGTCFVRSEFCKLLLRHRDQKKEGKSVKPMQRREWIQKLLWASFCYRQSNLIEPFCNFGGIPTTEELDYFLDYVNQVEKDEPDKEDFFFNRVYSTPGFEGYKANLARAVQANHWVLKHLAGKLAKSDTVKGCWVWMQRFLPGVTQDKGNDIAWQVTCDLLEAGCLLCTSDNKDFCHFSPSSIRKYCYLFPDSLTHFVCRCHIKHFRPFLQASILTTARATIQSFLINPPQAS